MQWWYGHNAVAFFLTTPILGLMYYFMPKAAERPVYSYRLRVVHFWSLIFLYIWAGPHHLLYTALPDWAQTLGMIFSVMLWAPSWGGMLNGLLTLRGAWDKLRTDPVIKFFVVAVTFYGMSTFEGPLLSIKSVNALGHYTDWIIGHVHGGTLGWNGFMTFGMIYWLWPRLYGTKLWSVSLAETHFWLATLGILLYVVSMWVSGVSQGLFWRALDAEGFLRYPDFIEGLTNSKAMYHTRLTGGLIYLLSSLLLVVNVIMTARQGKPATVSVQVPARQPAPRGRRRAGPADQRADAADRRDPGAGHLVRRGRAHGQPGDPGPVHPGLRGRHHLLRPAAEALGPLVRPGRAPRLRVHGAGAAVDPGRRRCGDHPHPDRQQQGAGGHHPGDDRRGPGPGRNRQVGAAALQPAGAGGPRRLHRRGLLQLPQPDDPALPPRGAALRRVLAPGGIALDHPFQWGSKRTGLDLARVGGKYDNLWHYLHLMDPRSTSPASNMPTYGHFSTATVDPAEVAVRMRAMQRLGVPYSDEDLALAEQRLASQAQLIADDLAAKNIEVDPHSEMVAMIAYLQRLGRGPQPVMPAPLTTAAAAAGGQ